MPGHNTAADTETQELGFNNLTHNNQTPSLLADFYTQDSSAKHAIKKIVAKCNKNQRNVHRKQLITNQEQDLILM